MNSYLARDWWTRWMRRRRGKKIEELIGSIATQQTHDRVSEYWVLYETLEILSATQWYGKQIDGIRRRRVVAAPKRETKWIHKLIRAPSPCEVNRRFELRFYYIVVDIIIFASNYVSIFFLYSISPQRSVVARFFLSASHCAELDRCHRGCSDSFASSSSIVRWRW